MASSIVQLIRGVALCTQTAADTAAVPASANWLDWVTSCKLTPNIGVEFPEFLNYRIWMESIGIPTTRMAAWEIELYADTFQTGWALFNFDGTPTGTPPAYIWVPGLTAAKFLTVLKVNKNLTTYRALYNGMCSEWSLSYDPKTSWKLSLKGVGIMDDNPGSPPVPSLPAPTDKSPMRAFWSVYTYAGSNYTMESFKLTLQQKIQPFFGSRPSAPISTTPAGVPPTDWEVNGMSATYDAKGKYSAFTGSMLHDYMHDTSGAITVQAIDPVTAGSNGMILTLPVAYHGSGEEDDASAISREHMTGHFLFNSGISGGVKVQLTNTGGGYAAS